MSACNFEYLLQFVNKQLDLDKQLEVYDHLDRCNICRDAVRQLSRDLDGVLFIHCAQGVRHYAFRRQIKRAWSGRAQVSANALARPAMRRRSNRLQ
jgi:predicted anti-sigma-YlaC factor YlaD